MSSAQCISRCHQCASSNSGHLSRELAFSLGTRLTKPSFHSVLLLFHKLKGKVWLCLFLRGTSGPSSAKFTKNPVFTFKGHAVYSCSPPYTPVISWPSALMAPFLNSTLFPPTSEPCFSLTLASVPSPATAQVPSQPPRLPEGGTAMPPSPSDLLFQ